MRRVRRKYTKVRKYKISTHEQNAQHIPAQRRIDFCEVRAATQGYSREEISVEKEQMQNRKKKVCYNDIFFYSGEIKGRTFKSRQLYWFYLLLRKIFIEKFFNEK